MAFGVPPPPIQTQDGSYQWLDWYRQLTDLLNSGGHVEWSELDFSGSNLTDITTRNHSDLQGLQGGDGAGNFYHSPAEIFNGVVNSDGTSQFLPNGWTSNQIGTGVLQVVHNLPLNYGVIISASGNGFVSEIQILANEFSCNTTNLAGTLVALPIMFTLFQQPA